MKGPDITLSAAPFPATSQPDQTPQYSDSAIVILGGEPNGEPVSAAALGQALAPSRLGTQNSSAVTLRAQGIIHAYRGVDLVWDSQGKLLSPLSGTA